MKRANLYAITHYNHHSLSPPLLTSMPASVYSPSLPRRGDAQSNQDDDERFGSSNNGVDGDGRPNQVLYGLKLS